MTRSPWIPRVLFCLACAVAVALFALLIVAPYLESQHRLVRLFANDPVVRRITFAGALGLLVTAFIFFRARGPREEPPRPRGPMGA